MIQVDEVAIQLDQKRLAEIDAQLRAAGYWGARLTALNEERQQVVERLAAAQRENRG